VKLSDLKPSFWEMCLVDFVARRTPKTRSAEMPVCERIAKGYMRKYPDAVAKAVEKADGNLMKVVDLLEPSFLAYARREVPDLLEKPTGMY
jgi:hypothetical protein